jgi:hypothetical protein
VADKDLEPGLYEALLTGALNGQIADLDAVAVSPEVRPLANAEAADRFSRQVATAVARAIENADEQDRAELGARIVEPTFPSIRRESSPQSCDDCPTGRPKRWTRRSRHCSTRLS